MMRRYQIALLVFSMVICVILMEIILRQIFPSVGRQYSVWHPNLRQIFRPSPEIMPGVGGDAFFITNSDGFRGDEIPTDASCRILTMGGSTTECLYLDQPESWPYLVQTEINAAGNYEKVWVGNAGKSGLTTREHIYQLKYLLGQRPKIDMIIMLVGGNDCLMRLRQGSQYDPHFLDQSSAQGEMLRRGFAVQKGYDKTLPWHKRTGIFRCIVSLKRFMLHEIQDAMGERVAEARRRRQRAPVREDIPDLNAGLEEYENNIRTMIDDAQRYSVRIIFLSQPCLWQKNLPEILNALLWFGETKDGDFYYSASAMGKALRQYNARLQKVCLEKGVPCVDLDKALPKDTSVFYDDLHFNESGARQVAHLVAQCILSQEGLRTGRSSVK